MAFINDPVQGTIEYQELVTSLSSQYLNGETILKRDFLVDWNDRWIFARRILGYHYVDTTPGGVKFIRRVVPDNFFARGMDDFTNPQERYKGMYASSMESMEGVRAHSWEPALLEGVYEKAKVSFTYRYPNYAIYFDEEIQSQLNQDPDPVRGSVISDVARKSSDPFFKTVTYPRTGEEFDYAAILTRPCRILRYISKSVQPTAEHLTLPYGAMRFVDGKVRPPDAEVPITLYGTKATNITVKLIAKTEIVYTWHSVPTSDITGASQVRHAQKYMGTVNKHAFDGYPPQTLLLSSINSRPFRQIGGHFTVDMELRMTYFEILEVYDGPNEDGTIVPDRNDDPPGSGSDFAIGHNYFLRFAPDSVAYGRAGENTLAEWLNLGYRYDLLTHDGQRTGRRLFAQKDFYEIFLPV